MSAGVAVTGPADARDQRWLNEQIVAIDDGIEAVLNIARNWTDERNLSRLHPGVSAQEYVLSRVQSPLGRGVVMPLLAESNWSNRQIAAVAGVSPDTVDRTARNQAVERPVETLGADSKLRPVRVVRAVVIEDDTLAVPFRVVAQTFERDARRLAEGYRERLNDERFAERYGPVIAAIDAAVRGG